MVNYNLDFICYENEKESVSSWNITLLWLGGLYCKSLSNKSVPVWHKNDINHKLVSEGEKAVDFQAYYMIRMPIISTI